MKFVTQLCRTPNVNFARKRLARKIVLKGHDKNNGPRTRIASLINFTLNFPRLDGTESGIIKFPASIIAEQSHIVRGFLRKHFLIQVTNLKKKKTFVSSERRKNKNQNIRNLFKKKSYNSRREAVDLKI